MRDRIAAGLDYEVKKAEIEIIALHEKLDQIHVGHLAELMGELQEQVRVATEMIKEIADWSIAHTSTALRGSLCGAIWDKVA
jgi:uncharacterized membrane protein